jgi:hypothetical protein
MKNSFAILMTGVSDTFNFQHSTFNPLAAQLPALDPGELEHWIASAVVVGGAVALGMKLFGRRNNQMEVEFVRQEEFRQFRMAVEHDLGGLRDRIDSRHLAVIETIEQLKTSLLSEAERRDAVLHRRLSDLEAGVARLDERTKRS